MLVTLGLAACSQDVVGQGIRGSVLSGPNCPVVQENVPCPDTPFQTDLVVTSVDGMRIVKRFSSSVDGSFEVSLPPGEYAIRSVNQTSLPYCATNDPVYVFERAMTETTVFCDTGIR
jgi:hypothetical protein